MLCDNCGRNKANIKYTENINGQRREMHLCEECSRKLGIMSKINFHMTTDFPSFFGSLLEDFEELESVPLFNEVKKSVCDSCNTSFDEIINTGKMGCPNCYDVFSERLDPLLKRIQGANRHVGRIAKEIDNEIKNGDSEKQANKLSEKESINKAESKVVKEDANKTDDDNKLNLLDKLQEQLKEAIKEERYEDAAKLRDEINKIKKENN